MARKFHCLLVWKLDPFGRSLVDCLNNIRTLEDHGIRFIAVTQGLDTDIQNPASRFLLHVLGAASEFERSLIRERPQAGRLRYRQDYNAGKVGKTVYSRIGEEFASRQAEEILQPRTGARIAAEWGQHQADCQTAWRWGGDGHADLTGTFQNIVAAISNRRARSAGSRDPELSQPSVQPPFRYNLRYGWQEYPEEICRSRGAPRKAAGLVPLLIYTGFGYVRPHCVRQPT